MSEEEKNELLKALHSDWDFSFNKTRIRRSYSFADYMSAIKLLEKITILSEELNHHPEIQLGWGHLEVELWTHTKDDLSVLDFELARRIDQASLTTSV
ncbi:MAG: 4a-hydroxytetrahydrobiopterin dehydratase [Bacteriovoracaceae bacterium]|jgi:4a-hydroxytetrahydrobiopterin dehydratase